MKYTAEQYEDAANKLRGQIVETHSGVMNGNYLADMLCQAAAMLRDQANYALHPSNDYNRGYDSGWNARGEQAKGAQGEAVAWMMTCDGHGRPHEFYTEKPAFIPPISKLVPLYTAPRAAVPDGYVLVPKKFGIPADAWEAAAFAFGGPGTGEGEPYIDCTAWIGTLDSDDDDMPAIHGLHVWCDECPEEGSITLAEFPAASSDGGEQGEQHE